MSTASRRVRTRAQDLNLDAVRRMLEAGWPADARGQHGGTALHWAAFHGGTDLVRLILHFKPPLEVVDGAYNATPLFWALYGSEHGWSRQTGDYVGTVKALLQAGAKPPTNIAGSPAVQAVLRELV